MIIYTRIRILVYIALFLYYFLFKHYLIMKMSHIEIGNNHLQSRRRRTKLFRIPSILATAAHVDKFQIRVIISNV